MSKFTWPEMRTYWESHSSRWANQSHDSDPDALGNVCIAGGPVWLNRYYAKFQRETFQSLLSRISLPSATARSLDVGCGSARWTRILADVGYRAVGIDLQPELIQSNRSRFPSIEFLCMPIQDYTSPEPFDLISSVTVVQHLPYDEQLVALRKMRSLLVAGGHLVLLENTQDNGGSPAPHVFPRSTEDWRSTVEQCRFRTVAVRPYDYSPFIRLQARARVATVSALKAHRFRTRTPTPTELVAARGTADQATVRGFLRQMDRLQLRLAVALDSVVEPILVRKSFGLSANHCGFLFEAV